MIFRYFACCVFAAAAFGQTAQFDVASVKASDPDSTVMNSLYTDKGGGLRVENYALRGIILFAYDLRDFELIGAPGWIDRARFDIVTKSEGGTDSDAVFREKMRSLLASRFGLVAHPETRQLTAYVLTVAKGGPKVKVVAVAGEQLGFRGGVGHNRGYAVTMPAFAKELARLLGRPVVDKTGVAGMFDYSLDWAGESDASGPSVYTALQEQMGLRIDSVKAPVEVVVVDRVARPGEN